MQHLSAQFDITAGGQSSDSAGLVWSYFSFNILHFTLHSARNLVTCAPVQVPGSGRGGHQNRHVQFC